MAEKPDSEKAAETEVVAADKIRSEQLELLLSQSYPAAFISPAMAVVLVAVLWSVREHTVLLSWYGAILFTTVMRLVVFVKYRQGQPSVLAAPAWERAYLVTALLYFLTWGLGGIWIMPAESQLHQVVVLYFLIGIAGSAVSVFSANRSIQLAAAVSVLLPGLCWFYAQSDFLSVGIAVAGTAFLLSAIRSSKILASAMLQNLRLKPVDGGQGQGGRVGPY